MSDILYGLAATVEVWRPAVVFILAVVVVFAVLFVFDSLRDK